VSNRKSWDKEVAEKIRDTRATSRPSYRQDPRHQERKGPREFDRNQCPAGWDPDVWSLALQFEQCAAREGIQLAVGRPIIYAALKDRCDDFRQVLYLRKKRWSLDGSNRSAPWQEVVSAAITRHFARYHEDEYAVDFFCGPVVFSDMIKEVWQHGHNLWIVRQIEEQYGPSDYEQSYAKEEPGHE